MRGKDGHDLIGGMLLAAFGAFVAIYAQRYEFGAAAQMGPGYFPVVLGWTLVVLGLAIALPAWWRRGSLPQVRWRQAGLVLGSLLWFAWALPRVGLALTVFAMVLLASLAEGSLGWRGRLLLAAGVTGLTLLVFVVGLQMRVPVWPGP